MVVCKILRRQLVVMLHDLYYAYNDVSRHDYHPVRIR